MEWRLFDSDTVPDFTTQAFFEGHPHVPGEFQRGYFERMAMVAELLEEIGSPETTLSDLGCGDGYLLQLAGPAFGAAWGYDLGDANRARAAERGVDVRHRDILRDELEYGDVISCVEVIEHLVDPRAFLDSLPSNRPLVASSPSTETGEWHYEHHAWAWDLDGYRHLFESCGWTVLDQRECDAGFQAVVVTWP